ncbi:MAG: PHP domain-containing protein [Burkholderiaceae bacterium]|jgi:predicted metal-dependent phosphoesterase TrpH|nr:PHP domain-containing protein [Burkholderiaceae bacterium]
MTMNIDLHTHSKCSDGLLSPAELVERAVANGTGMLALTDHDMVKGVAPARTACESAGIRFVPGVEISITWGGRSIHIVGLQVDESNAAFVKTLDDNRAGRVERAKEISRRLALQGIDGAYEYISERVFDPIIISRKHFSRFLVEKEICPDTTEAFDRFLKRGRPAYVFHKWMTLEESIHCIREAGGISVVAHPGRYDISETALFALFDEFKALGGVGIEVVTGSHSPDKYAYFARLARRYGFLASAGSDFHAPYEGYIDVGRLPPLPQNLTPIWHDWF